MSIVNLWCEPLDERFGDGRPVSLGRQAADALVEWRRIRESFGTTETLARHGMGDSDYRLWTIAGQIIEARKQLPPTAAGSQE